MRRLPPPSLATCAVLACALAAAPALAACPTDAAVEQFAEALLENRPSPAFTGMTSLEDGFCAQEKLVEILRRQWGRPIGYKLGLTNASVQQRFGVTHPVRGTVLESFTSLRSGGEVPARFGAIPVIESDFLVRVRDAGINAAGQDHLEILRHLDVVIPFIELADLALSGGFDGPNLLAINVGARLGVVGEPIPVQATQEFADRLAEMTVTMVDDRGQERARAQGRAVLGHPLNAVAFLIEDLAKQGKRLEAGQVLSIAGFSPTLPVEAGRTYTVRYEGLVAEPVSVSVRVR